MPYQKVPGPRALSPFMTPVGACHWTGRAEEKEAICPRKPGRAPLRKAPLWGPWGRPEGTSGGDENIADQLVPLGVLGVMGSEPKVKGTEDGNQGEGYFPGKEVVRQEGQLTLSPFLSLSVCGSGQLLDTRRLEACLSFG